MSEYVVIYEEASDGWGAYLPDLPGVVSHGATGGIREALALYLDELRRAGLAVPQPRSLSGVVAAA